MALPIWQATIVDDNGVAQASASVEVRRESDNGLASLFSDRAGLSPISNPMTTGADGFAQFYLTGGEYKITATSAAGTKTWRYVEVQDFGTAATKDVGTLSTQVPLNSDLGTASTKDVGTLSTQVPLNSDLGTAATADVTTSTTDTTAGRLLKVADFGVGSANAPRPADLNTVDYGGICAASGAANSPTTYGTVLTGGYNANGRTQLFSALTTDKLFFRQHNSDISLATWQELWHTGNLETAGTWTPSITFGSASTGITYSTRLGVYHLIGDICYVAARMTLSSKGTATGIARIEGLPFVNGDSFYIGASFFAAASAFSGQQQALVVPSSATVNLYDTTSAADNTDFLNNTDIVFTAVYKRA